MSTLEPSQIAQAVERLKGVANRTPVVTSRTLNEQTGRQIYMKCENFQRVGAFKFRGAYNAISQLSDEQKAAGVITHSSGNHAQGLALAAKLLGVPAVVVMPEDAPAVKREATAGYGAQIVPCKAIEREEVTTKLAAEHGYALIHPYDNDQIIIGQGTAAWELFEEVGELDLLFVPVGGGGLLSGSALAAAAKSPGCRVIGVEPAAGPDAGQSWRAGQIVNLDQVPDTLADGLRTRHIGERNLAIMRRYVADMVTVSEADITATLQFIWQRLKIIVEPSAAVALAPLFTGRYTAPGQRVGVLFSGGNVEIRDWGVEIKEPETGDNVTPVPSPTANLQSPSRPRVLVGDPVAEEALTALRQVAEVDVRPGMSEEELQAVIGPYHGLLVRGSTRVTEAVIEEAFNLRVIGCAGGRLDNVDVSAARDYGIEVRYTPGINAVAAAEHTLALMLILAGRFGQEGEEGAGGLAGKTLGLVGFGRIGRQVAQRALAFDMRVLVNQPRLTPELALDPRIVATDLLDLLGEADFVSLHVPFKAETDTLLCESELALMKPGAFLINIAHTDLVDDEALLAALTSGRLAGAALATYSSQVDGEVRPAAALRQHPHVIPATHVAALSSNRPQEAAVTVAGQMSEVLRTRRPNESLSLEVVPIEMVSPHEAIDDKRVTRLAERLKDEDRLVNPPVVTYWNGRYVILDGATRFTAMERLGFPHIIVQVVDAHSRQFTLHTWYHAISSERPVSELFDHLRQIEGLVLTALPTAAIQGAFSQPQALCYFLDRDGQAMLAQAEPAADRLAVMNALVASYTTWGEVERTLLTDLARLRAQFPQMVAVAVFPQFAPEDVFSGASQGELLPAGLTRFLIPGRILRLNADLHRLKQDEPLATKRAWLNQFLEEKLARSRLRYYQEPVILLDE
jgi:threonine dehydratase/phosphoglycerate dehydrogenase-like enzyme